MNIGKGSKSQLKNLFEYIQTIQQWDNFLERMEILLQAVFREDIVLYVKNPDFLEIYFISCDTLKNELITNLQNYKNENLFIKRWENNTIRLSAKKLKDISDFSIKEPFNNYIYDIKEAA